MKMIIRRQRNLNNQHGSITLEAALCLPILLLFAWTLVALIQVEKTRVRLESALHRTCSEIALCSPAVAMIGDMTVSDSEQDQAGWQKLEELGASWQELIPWPVLRQLIQKTALDITTTQTIGRLVAARAVHWIDELTSADGKNLFTDNLPRIYLDWDIENRQLWIQAVQSVPTPLGSSKVRSRAAAPLWLGTGKRITMSNRQPADTLWDLDNFARGKAFRQRMQGELPEDYPVLASFRHGEAIAMTSIDITAPSYQKRGAFYKRVESELKQLAEFQGATYRKQGTQIQISEQDIEQRSLLVIIPENKEPAWFQKQWIDVQNQAARLGVQVNLVRDGISRRFQSENENKDN